MYQNILVPLDGSEQAEGILYLVENLAIIDHARVIFLKVEDPPIMLEYDEVIDIPAYERMRQECRTRNESYLAELQGKFQKKGIEAQCQIASGPVVSTILGVSESERVDLIAISIPGSSELYLDVDKNVVVSLLQKADRPLLLVRD